MKYFPRSIIMVGFLLAILPLVSACVAFNMFNTERHNPDTATLSGTSWVLASFSDAGMDVETPLPGTQNLTVAFDADGQINGFAGCNYFFADYVINGDDTLTVSGIGVEDMDCDDEVMVQEERFLAALEDASMFRIFHTSLDLYYSDTEKLHFAQPDVDPSTPLANSSWELTHFYIPHLGQQGLRDGTRISLRILANGEFTGFGGCNNYTGTYTVTDSKFLVTSVERNMRPCDLNTQQQEDQYLNFLQQSKTFELNGMTLSIEHLRGQELQYYLRK